MPESSNTQATRALTLTESQLLFWFSHKVNPEVQLYFDRVTVLLEIDGPVERRAFEQAFTTLTRQCDALRTRIREVDGVPERLVLGSAEITLEHFDFSGGCDADARVQAAAARLNSLPLADAEPAAFLAKLGERRYGFCLSLHHLLTDAWSTKLIIDRLSALYQAEVSGQTASLPSFAAFDTFLAHTVKYRASPSYQAAQLYWRTKLSEPPEHLRFYAGDAGAAATATFRVSQVLNADQSERLRRVASDAGFFSPAVYFQAVLAAYVARVSGTTLLRMGVPFANRSSDFRAVCGLLMNPCAMQMRIEDDTFASLARKLQREYLETARHALFPVKNPAGEKAYEVYFNYQNVSYTDFAGFPARFQLCHSGASTDVLALQVHDFNATGCFQLDFDFSRRHFDESQGADAVEHYLNLLDALLADEGGSIRNAKMLSTRELARVVEDFNGTELPRAQTLLDSEIRSRARATPDALALVTPEGSVSYAELDRRAARLAARLQAEGVGPGSLVAVLAHRSLEMVVALLGSVYAGAAYVPIDPTYPDERIRVIVDECGNPPILAHAEFVTRPALEGRRVVELDEARAPARDTPVHSSRRTVRDAAYVIFTSGSTGVPKGVVNTHAGICNRLSWMQEAYPLSTGDRVLQKTPFTFDVSVWEFFWPLATGATLVVLPPEKHKDAQFLARFVREQQVSVLHFVPSMLGAFLDVADGAACPSIRRVICSGEALAVELVEKFHRRFEQASLHNLYGPTEAAIDVSFFDCTRDVRLRHVPIGKPIANLRLYILDAHLNPLPLGATGEIHIGGVGLAREYLNRPELTAERFVSVPRALDPDGRLYKTGDLGRFGRDGNIEYLGRRDHQIKLRGFRIELGEVEATCRRFHGVKEAVVDFRAGERGEGYLAAYVVREPDAILETQSLRDFLSAELPEYMVPSLIAELPALPLSPNGKIDRKSLPDHNDLRSAEPSVLEDASNPVELRLSELWKTNLKLDRVGVTENFFELGGHSLMALEIISQIQQSFDCELSLSLFFDRKATIQNLAREIQSLTSRHA